jgi:hypothetical protein
VEAESVIKGNSRIKENEMAAMMDDSYGSSHCIIHDVLQFRKVSARLMPG